MVNARQTFDFSACQAEEYGNRPGLFMSLLAPGTVADHDEPFDVSEQLYFAAQNFLF